MKKNVKMGKELKICEKYVPNKTKTTQLTHEQSNDQNIADKIIFDIVDKLKFDKLPSDITISTMTLTCKINTTFDCRNIARFVDLSYAGILSVKCGSDDDEQTNRSLIPKKQKTGKKKKKRCVFYNQVSIYVMVKGKNKKPVSVKLFLNGSIQLTGCKTVNHAVEAITKIFTELSKIKGIIVMKNYCLEVVEHKFVPNREILHMKNIKDLKVVMINSNFSINFKIDRAKLHNLMLAENFEVTYDPEKHACVNIKYDHVEKALSIFVFEGGSIIITGVRNCSQIVDAYNFINKYLLINYNKIVKNENLINSNIIKFLDKEMIKEHVNETFMNNIETDSEEDFNYDSEYTDTNNLEVLDSLEEELTEAEKYMSEIYKFSTSESEDEKPKKINKQKSQKITKK